MRVYCYQMNGVVDAEQRSIHQLLSVHGAHVVERDEDGNIDFSKIEAVIINGSSGAMSISYVIAMAVAKQKPILFLLQKGEEIPQAIQDFRHDAKIKSLFSLEFFEPHSLPQKIENFIVQAEGGVKEVPSIKFTLRITPSMERYLQWKSQKLSISKADYLRTVIAEEVKNDQDFQS